MWPGTPELADLLAGDHRVTITADAWYRGQLTRADLPVTKASLDAQWDERAAAVRSSIQLEIDDAEGDLVPTRPTDPLAPFGQCVVVAVNISAGVSSERVPIGEYRIDESPADGGWRAVTKRDRTRWLPTGGTITMPLSDNLARLADADLWGLLVPRGPTVLQEVQRLCHGLMRFDWTGVTDKPMRPGGAAYGDSRIDAIANLARALGRQLAITRDGALTMVNAAHSAPVLDITPESHTWINTHMHLSPDGIVNTVATTGPTADDKTPPPAGFAQITTGPYGAHPGGLGPRLRRHHSDFYRTRNQAQLGAQTLLTTLTKNRTMQFEVQSAFDPRMDILDTHRVTVRPGGERPLTVNALLVGIRADLAGGPMTLTYRVPLEALT